MLLKWNLNPLRQACTAMWSYIFWYEPGLQIELCTDILRKRVREGLAYLCLSAVGSLWLLSIPGNGILNYFCSNACLALCSPTIPSIWCLFHLKIWISAKENCSFCLLLFLCNFSPSFFFCFFVNWNHLVWPGTQQSIIQNWKLIK